MLRDMARHATGSIRRLALQAAASASALSPRAALLAIGTVFVVFLWALAIAPPLVSCALAAALASRVVRVAGPAR